MRAGRQALDAGEMTRAYYNEFDPGTAAWLRELIKRGLIADGEVDGRSIVDVRAEAVSPPEFLIITSWFYCAHGTYTTSDRWTLGLVPNKPSRAFERDSAPDPRRPEGRNWRPVG